MSVIVRIHINICLTPGWKLTRWLQPGSLALHSHALLPHVLYAMTLPSYVTAEITDSTVHVPHEVLAWLQATSCGMPE